MDLFISIWLYVISIFGILFFIGLSFLPIYLGIKRQWKMFCVYIILSIIVFIPCSIMLIYYGLLLIGS